MRSVARLCTALPLLVAACAPKGETAVNDSVATAAPPVVDVATVRSAIEQTNTKFAAALQSGDSATVVSVYDADAIVMMANQPAWRGKSEITTNGIGMLKAVKFSDVRLNTSTVDVAGDFAIETGSYEMTLTETGKKPMPDKGKYISVWKKQSDGSWKLYRDISNSDLPAKQ